MPDNNKCLSSLPILRAYILIAMDAELHAPTSPVCLTEGHTTEQETVLWVRCHDRHLQHTTVTGNNGEKLFYVKGPGGYRSMTLRRPLKDALGHPVFDLRRYAADPKMRWFVEDPSGRKIAELSHMKFFTSKHTAIDAKIFSSGVLVEMRPRDAMASTNYISIGNVIIAEISVHINNVPRHFVRGQDLSVFRVRVAKGVDLSLVC